MRKQKNNEISLTKLLVVVLLLVSIKTRGQSATKGFEYLKQQKYTESIESFKKALKKKKDVIASKFGLARIYSNTNYKKYRYSKAYIYIVYVVKHYFKQENKVVEKLKQNYGIDDISIGKLRLKILNNALNEAQQKHDVEALKTFRLDFPNTEQSKQAFLYEQQLAFSEAVNDNSLAAIVRFINNYPKSAQIDSAKRIVKKFEKQAFHAYTYQGELEMITEYEKQFPNCSRRDSLQKLKILAQTAFRLNLDDKYMQSMEKFYFDYIKKAAPAELAYVALLRTLTPYIDKKDWNAAVQILKNHKKYFKNNSRIDSLISILNKPSNKIETKSVSNIINTQGHEYSPVLTADGSTMYFCGRNREENIGGEDIFVSKFKDNKWTKPQILKSINTPFAHEAPLSISADGNTMLLYANTNVYYSNKRVSGWSMPRAFPAINRDDSWEADAMLTADGNAILFISDRKENIGDLHPFGELFHGSHAGNSDIYVSYRNKAGRWTKPINLGTTINTPYSERSPFLHPDMKTLYFSSDGRAGLGKLDVYKTVRLNDSSWTEWSEPVNLGKEINSYDDDYDYKISTDGSIALLSSFKDENFNILQMNLPKEVQPEKVAIVSGFITDESGKPIHAKIKWENLETGEITGFSKSDIVDGSYMIILPLNKNYGYFIEHQNYYPLSGNIDLRGVSEQTKLRKNFILYTYSDIIRKKLSIPLENVFFESNKYKLKPESYTELDRFISFLQKNNNLRVEISGHTDNEGSTEHNKNLSLQRAKSVLDYIVSKGVDPKRIISKGYGESMPIAPNDTEKGKAKNRRVEFKVVE